MKSQKVTFQKHRNCLLRTSTKGQPIQNIQIAIHSISKAGYVTAVLAIVRTELCAQEASSLCDF